MVTVGGFETETPPIETFAHDPTGISASYGDYEGSVVGLVFTLDEGQGAAEMAIGEPGVASSVVYMPGAGTDISAAYLATAGSIEVTEVRWTGDAVRVRGTFQATVSKMDGSASAQLVDGTFDVGDIPSQATVTSGT
jgi:hypothetical protein